MRQRAATRGLAAAAVLASIAAAPPPRSDGEVSVQELLVDVADLFLKRGEYDRAIEVYGRILRKDRGSVEARVKLAEACLASEACAPRREAVLEAALRAAHHRLDLLEELHELLIKKGEHRRALELLHGFLEHDGKNVAVLRLLVDTLVLIGDTRGALREIRRQLALEPRDPTTRLLEIELLEALERPDELELAIEKLTAELSEVGDGWILRGERSLEQGAVAATAAALARAREGTIHAPDGNERLLQLQRDLDQELDERRRDREAAMDDFRRDIRGADAREDIDEELVD